MIDALTKAAIDRCVRLNIPFGCYIMPGSDCVNFVASPSGAESVSDIDSAEGFVISTFELADSLTYYVIRQEAGVREILDLSADMEPKAPATAEAPATSTRYEDYISAVKSIIAELDGDGEKTVYSRVMNLTSDLNPSEAASRYFACHPSCFRFIYFTPQTGLWIGASPELLLSVDRVNGVTCSMSVAGTRRRDENSGAWDMKNRMEHDIVTRYISDVLSDHIGRTARVEESSACFGQIEHLCHSITVETTAGVAVSPSRLLPLLSPTPALCGWPREKSYRMIRDRESYERLCYGGFVGQSTLDGVRLFVNLRSAMVSRLDDGNVTYCYSLYGGGGITVHSDPQSEWEETAQKMKSLQTVLLGETSQEAVAAKTKEMTF